MTEGGEEEPEIRGEEEPALRETVEAFLDDADAAVAEYDQGYADADATLSILRRHIEELREATDTT